LQVDDGRSNPRAVLIADLAMDRAEQRPFFRLLRGRGCRHGKNDSQEQAGARCVRGHHFSSLALPVALSSMRKTTFCSPAPEVASTLFFCSVNPFARTTSS